VATAGEFVAAVDAFMATRKTIVGADTALAWAPARDEGCLCIKLPLEINGEQHGQTLMVQSCPNSPFVPNFNIMAIWSTAVSRLDFDGTSHGNKVPWIRDVPAVIHGPHYHPWALNKRFVTNAREHQKLPIAVALPPNIQQFDAALRWFCADNNIDLPRGHRIELPPRTRLI
jgi:hypothetical protein